MKEYCNKYMKTDLRNLTFEFGIFSGAGQDYGIFEILTSRNFLL